MVELRRVGRFFLPVVVVLFWGVMTFFLVQRTYFPDFAAGAKVPVAMVSARLFQEEAENHVMVLYEGRKKLGDVNVTTRRMIGEEGVVYQFRFAGFMRQSSDEEVGLRVRQVVMDFTVDGMVQALEGEFSMVGQSGFGVMFGWSKATGGDVYVRMVQDRLVIFDSKLGVGALQGMDGGKEQVVGLLQSMGVEGAFVNSLSEGVATEPEEMIWEARESRLWAAGQMRDGYNLSMPLLFGREELVIFVTGQGELVRVSLGERWELLSAEWFPEF